MARNPENPSRLKAEIDSGRTGDKVPFPDPGAAPLGTDAEAGGNPPNGPAVRRAARDEAGSGVPPQPNVSDESGRTISGEMRGGSPRRVLVPLAIIGGVAVLGIVLAILLV